MKFLLVVLSLAPSFAWADAAPAAAPASGMQGLLLQLPPILAIGALFYFVLIRPQRQQQQKHNEFLKKLERGEEVVTASGIIGTIVGLTDRVVTLDIAPGTEIKMLRSQVTGYLKEQVDSKATQKLQPTK
jgi:preprotein translocase subunit YajC